MTQAQAQVQPNQSTVFDEYNRIIAWLVEQQRDQALTGQAQITQLQTVIQAQQVRIKELEAMMPNAAKAAGESD